MQAGAAYHARSVTFIAIAAISRHPPARDHREKLSAQFHIKQNLMSITCWHGVEQMVDGPQ